MVPLGVYRWTHALGGGGGGHVWFNRYVLLCMIEVYGIFNLKKIFNFTTEKHKQDCNMNAFYLKQGQN